MQNLAFLAAVLAVTLMAPPTWAKSTADGADHAHADHAAPSADDAAWTLGNLTLTAPFSRATLPHAPVAGGFLTISNGGDADDRLIAASSAIAGKTEIHEMAMDGDVMSMRALPDGLPIPAGATVTLAPGGYHLMFMRLTGPLVEGETVDVTLTFQTAGEITVPLSVQAFNARAADDAGAVADPHAGH